MNEFVKKIARVNSMNVISFKRTENDTIIYWLLVKKAKDSLEIIQKETILNFEELEKKINKSLPVVIHIHGSGILLKKIDLENQNDKDWVRNLDSKNISATVFKDGNFQYYSLLRNTIIDEIFEKIKSFKLKIVEYYFGPSIVGTLKEYRNIIFQIDEYKFDFTNSGNECIVRNQFITNESNHYNEDFELEYSYFHAYAAAIGWFAQPESLEVVNSNSIDKEEIYYESAFNRIGKYTLITFFLALLVSYFLVLWLGYKNSEMTFEKVYSGKNIALTQKLNEDIKEKIEILNATGIASNKYLAFYLNEVAKTIPSQIQLEELKINSLKNEIRESKKVEFFSKEIVVKGSALNDLTFNEWITFLKKKSWIKSLKIDNVSKDKSGNILFEVNVEF